MSQILFRGTSIEKRNTIGYGFAIALGITGVALAVILLVVGKNAPGEADTVIAVSGPVGLALLLAGTWMYFSVRGDLFITKNGNAYGVTIVNSKKKKVVEIYSPFTISCYYDLQRVGRNQKAYFLYVIFSGKANRPVLLLESGRASVFGKPDGWKQLEPGVLEGAEKVYTCSHISDASKVLRSLMK